MTKQSITTSIKTLDGRHGQKIELINRLRNKKGLAPVEVVLNCKIINEKSGQIKEIKTFPLSLEKSNEGYSYGL